MPGLKIFEALNQMLEMVDPETGLVKPKEVNLSVTEKQNFSNEGVSHIRYDKGLFYDKAKDLQEENIALGSDPEAVNDLLAEKQTNLGATVNALTKFVGKTAITVGDTVIGGLVSIPSAIVNGDMSKLYDNDFHRAMDKASNWMENVMPIYETKAQEEENFWGKLNNAKFWGDGVMGGLSFTVGAVLSEMALSALTGLTGGATAEIQAAQTVGLMSRAKKMFSLFGKDATSAELKAFGKDITKSLAVGAGYEAGVEARNFLDTARQNYIEQYRQQYGTEPTGDVLANADGEFKKTANLLFGANMALLSVDNYIQFKNIFGKGLSTDLKLFGKGAVKTEGKELAKDFALRGTLEASYETASKLRKTLYTVPKLLKNPLNEMFEEGTQGIFNSIGQDYIKKKYDALAYDEAFSTISSFNKNMKDAYLSEDAGIGFIIGAMGIPGMGIATGKVKNAKGFGNKLIASFEGGIAEVFEENRAEKEAIKNAVKLSSKVNIDNVLSQLKEASVNYNSTRQRDTALENGDFFEAKNAESDNMFSFVKTRDNVGLINETKEQYGAMIKGMDDVEFAKTFGYDKVDANEKALSSMELYERKKKVVEAFNKKVDNFQQSKELASKVAPIRNFNDDNSRLFNEAIHHLMYTTNDLDGREDSLVEGLKNKLSKTKDIDSDRVKNLMNFHNTWYTLTQGEYSKHLQSYLKDLALLERYSAFQHTTSEEDAEYKENQAQVNKVQKRIKNYESLFEREITKFGENQSKLANHGFNIDYNFKDMDSFKNAVTEYEALKNDIQTHLNQNIFDKTDVEQSLQDLQKIQTKRHQLIGTYNYLNTKEGRKQSEEDIKKTKKQFKIDFLFEQAKKFLHNQGVEIDEDTIKEIKKNVDLQIDEKDDEMTKEVKSQISQMIDRADKSFDITDLKQIIEDLKAFKEFEISSELSDIIDDTIKDINDKIKSLQKEGQQKAKSQKELQKEAIFESPKRLLKLFNDFTPEQKEHFYNVVKEIQASNLSPYQKEEQLKQRISFKLVPNENPNTPEEAKQKDIDNLRNNNDTVTQVNGIRTEGVSPFNFEMLIDGKSIGGFMMPNQIFIKDSKGKWSQIDFEKIQDDSYLQKLLPKLFPESLISTEEDRLELGKYLKEHNDLSKKLSKAFAENVTKTDYTFEELDKELDGLLTDNKFTSQITVSIDKSNTSRNVEDILDNADDLITKAATVEINGQKLILFGKSTATGKGFSKKYFVKLINGKLERNANGKVIWNTVEGSDLQLKITDFLSTKDSKDKTDFINTKDSLFSLLVFEPNGYIRTIFTTNELIGKIQDDDNDIVIKFNKNKKNLQPVTDKIGDSIKQFFIENKDKKKEETKDIFINDYFIPVKNANDSKVEITPVIQDGELTFRIKDINKKVLFVNTYIYFNGTNFIKLKIKDNDEAKQINKDYREGKITLSERFEKLKPYSHPINDLNEVIGELFLDGQKLKPEEFKDDRKNYYSVLTAVRKATGTNQSSITGFYKDIAIDKNNQQDLENLQIKKDLNYFLYLRPGNSQFSDINDFSENVRNREEQKQIKKAEDELLGILNQSNNEILEKQEEATTVEQVISNSPDAVSSNNVAIMDMLNPKVTNSLSEDDLLIQAAKNLGLDSDNLPMLKSSLARNSKLRTEVEKLKSSTQAPVVQETKVEVVDKKAEIKRRQEELEKPYKTVNDGSGKMATVTAKTTEKEGVKKTKFQTETTNRKGESRIINNKGYNTFEEAIENLEIDLDSEENETALEFVEALKENSKGKATARVTEIREGTDKSSPFYGKRVATVIVNGEAIDFTLKNDAELAALKTNKTEEVKPIVVKNSPATDKLKDLGLSLDDIIDSFDSSSNEDAFKMMHELFKKKYNIPQSLEEFLKIVNAAKLEGNDGGVNKLLKLSEQDLIEYNQAVKNLMQILPVKTKDNPNGIIEITDVLDILKNLKTKGEVAGRFISKMKTIYLATQEGKSVKGIEYHEAFHAIFRMFLTDSKITKYLKAAEELYGSPTTEQLTELKNSSSDLINLSQRELKNLWLEEKMADAFMDFMKVGPVKTPQSWLARIFHKIRAFLFGLFNNKKAENDITRLFQDIYSGKFKDAKEKYPIQRKGVTSADVNKLLIRRQSLMTTTGAVVKKESYFSNVLSETIINTVTNEIAKQGIKTINNDEINNVIEKLRERFNPTNDYNQSLLQTIGDRSLRMRTFTQMSEVYSNLFYDKDKIELYKKLNKIQNADIIREEVLNRLPLYNISKEASTLQEQSDENINEVEDSENDYGDGDNNGIIGKKTNEINHAWEKASKRVKQYISSASMKTDLFNIGQPFINFMEQQEKEGNTDLVKNYEFAIRGSNLYSNLIKMLVNTPSYKMIGMVYSMADTSPEMKYFVQHWFKDIYNDLKDKIDIPVTNTSNLDDLYETLKSVSYSDLNNNSEYFTFMASDLEKNRIFLWDIVFDESGVTRFLNANNREVAKQVFNRWTKNWESKRVDDSVTFQKFIDDYTNIYKEGDKNIFQEYVDILKNKSSSEEKGQEIQILFNKIQKEFSKLGIELPSGYVKYSLINYVVSINQQQLLSDKQYDWFINFSASGIKPLDKEALAGIENALLQAKTYETYSIYTNVKDGQVLDIGVISRLKDIGESVGMFDPTVIPSSFNNQEGKRIYDIVPPSDISRRLNLLKDTVNVSILKDYIKTKDADTFKKLVLNNDINNTYYFYGFFTSEKQVDNFLQTIDNNPLLQSKEDDYLNMIFSTLNMSYAGGIRQDELAVSERENSDEIEVSSKGYGLFSDSEGRSYSNADTTAKIVYQLSLLAESEYNQYNIKKVGEQKFAYYKFTQPESKSTVPIVLLPYNEMVNSSGITEKAKEMMFFMFKQEYDRITKVQKEIDEFINGKKSGYSENYHYVNEKFKDLGDVKVFKNSENKFYYLDINDNNIAKELTEQQLKEVSVSKLSPRGAKFFNFANTAVDLHTLTEDARKGIPLTTQKEDFINTELQRFFNIQFEDFIKLLKQTDINIIKVNDESQEVSNLLPNGFMQKDSNLVDRTKLMNAFLNDYVMSYSINSLMYGDNANVAKDAVDWVKRAGGIIGSGNNYGSGESNVIIIKSEVKDDTDITNAQTFSNPFWHLTTILKNKGANDEKIREIYRKIDSGLETPTAEEYQYLYDNQAQHQSNKTQGYGFEHYLKTSIAPLLRNEVSRLKRYESKEDAIALHTKLFEYKLRFQNELFNPKYKNDENVIEYFKGLERYHNMFEAIPGMEYRHNLLNISEQHNAVMVYDSGWKRNKTNVHLIENGKPYLYKDNDGNNTIEPIRIANSSMVDQQKTDGVKNNIIDGTQKQRLIVTEQDANVIVKFRDKETTLKTVLSTYEKLQALRIKRGFDKLKKEIIDKDGSEKWETMLASFNESIQASSADPQILELFQIENGKPKYNLNNPAIETKYQAMFLSFISNGVLKQKTAGSKFTLMSEIGFNLMREVDGEGNIIRTLTNNETKNTYSFDKSKFISHRLRHDVEVRKYSTKQNGEISYDKDGKPIYKVLEYYSEIVVSERFLKKFGFTREQFYKGEIPEQFLYLQGIRIPTEDKHSMINAKIVDILPDSYGNVIMMPYEIVNLSGADFDIDSLYAKVTQTYSNVLNKKTELYGSYLSKPTLEEASFQAYNEYLAESFEDRKVAHTFNDLKENNIELKKLQKERADIDGLLKENNKKLKEAINIDTIEFLQKEKQNIVKILNEVKDEIKSLELELIKQSFDINDILFNKEQWIAKNKETIETNYNYYNSTEESDVEKINPITKGELNNHLLELERKLTNNYGNNKIANTPTSLEIFKKLVKVLDKEGLIKKEMGYGIHDMLSKIKADMAISTGAANIGPAALFNNLFGLLVKYNVTTENPVLASNAFELLSLDKNNQEIIDEKEKQRIQDTLASVLAAMTDNAKEQLADVFNLTINTLPVALTMIATGNNFDNVMLLMKNPIVKRIAEIEASRNKTVQSEEDYRESRKQQGSIKQRIQAEFDLSDSDFQGNLTYDDLLNALKAQPKVTMWETVQTDIQTKYPEITEEMYNTLSEQEKEKLIECL